MRWLAAIVVRQQIPAPGALTALTVRALPGLIITLV